MYHELFSFLKICKSEGCLSEVHARRGSGLLVLTAIMRTCAEVSCSVYLVPLCMYYVYCIMKCVHVLPCFHLLVLAVSKYLMFFLDTCHLSPELFFTLDNCQKNKRKIEFLVFPQPVWPISFYTWMHSILSLRMNLSEDTVITMLH